LGLIFADIGYDHFSFTSKQLVRTPTPIKMSREQAWNDLIYELELEQHVGFFISHLDLQKSIIQFFFD